MTRIKPEAHQSSPRRRRYLRRDRVFTAGHSWVAGRYVGAPPRAWPQLVAAELGLRLRNLSVAGSGMGEAAERVDSIQIYREADWVIMQGALNDARKEGASIEAARRLAAGIAETAGRAEDRGLHMSQLMIVSDPRILAWEASADRGYDRGSDQALSLFTAELRDTSRLVGCRFVDLSIGWDPQTMLAPDRIHPNEHGVRHVARSVVGSIDDPTFGSG